MQAAIAYFRYRESNPPVGVSARRNIPPQAAIDLVDCSLEEGLFLWRARPPELFSDEKGYAERVCKTWNAKNARKPAFCTLGSYGYLWGRMFGMTVAAHQLVWVHATGEWPRQQIDHINGVYTDNRIENLREVSHEENGRNQKLNALNTSGVAGVTYCKRDKVWKARIVFRGRHYNLGESKSFDVAAKLRLTAEAYFGFHPNHGKERQQCPRT